MATRTVKATRTIPQGISIPLAFDIISLAIAQRSLREARAAVSRKTKAANAKMPGAAWLASDRELVTVLLRKYNRHCARLRRGAK